MTQTNALTPAGIHNFRDLGGIPLEGGQQVRRGAIFRSCALRDTAIPHIPGHAGPARVIDLRSEAEIAADPGALAACKDRVCIPLFAGLDPVSALLAADPDARLSQRYIIALDTVPEGFAAVMTAIARAPEGPVVFHCTAGKDRTGLVAALLLSVLGASPDSIARDYAETASFAPGLLRRLERDARDRGGDPALIRRILSSNAEDMLSVFDHIEARHGDASTYLTAAGLSAADTKQLKRRLVVCREGSPGAHRPRG